MVSALDDAITRLRAISVRHAERSFWKTISGSGWPGPSPIARTLRPLTRPTAGSQEAEALELLTQPMTEPGLKDFPDLLKADLLRRADRLVEAAAEIEAAAKSDPPPPEREILDVRLPDLARKKKYAEARAAITAHI